MVQISFFIFFTIIAASFIIEPVLSKNAKKAPKTGKKVKRINTASADEGVNFSVGNYSGPGSSSYEQPQKDDTEEINLFTSDIQYLSGNQKTTPPPSHVMGFTFNDDEMEKFRLWPDGVIPYYIDVNSFSDKVLRDKIRSFLNNVNSMTSINFIEYPSPPEDDDARWVFFINRRGLLGCAEHSVWNFTTKGVQRVVLGYDCMNNEGELAEAVLAIAGVPAQHTAPDRDEYIKVYIDNVIPDKRNLFDKLPDGDWLFHEIPYDYNSAGHYHNFKYSENGRAVIIPLDQDVIIGETKVLSDIDILKIKLLYDYITKKKRLDAPECEKLFKAGKKIKNFKPENIVPKPNRKPSKYKTEAQADVEYFDESEKPLNTDMESLTFKSAFNKDKRKQKPRKKDLLSNLPDDHSGEIKQLKAKIKNYDPLGDLSDYTSNDEDKKIDLIKHNRFETLKAAG